MTFADRDEMVALSGFDGRDPEQLAHYLMILRYDPHLTDPDEMKARLELCFPNLDDAVLGKALDYLQDLLAGKRIDKWGHV